MLLGIPEAAWDLEKWKLGTARFIQVYPGLSRFIQVYPGLSPAILIPKFRPKIPVRGFIHREHPLIPGVLNSSHFSAHPNALAGVGILLPELSWELFPWEYS